MAEGERKRTGKRKREENMQTGVFMIENNHKGFIDFVSKAKDPNLIEVRGFERSEDGNNYVLQTEPYTSTLDQWMSDHSAVYDGNLDKEGFLVPICNLIKSFGTLRGYMSDFTFDPTRVLVVVEPESQIASFKILTADKYPRDGEEPAKDHCQCVTDIYNFIRSWTQNEKEQWKEPNFKLFAHSLVNFGTYFTPAEYEGGFTVISKHPIFYRRKSLKAVKSKKALFDMSYKFQRIWLAERQGRSPSKSLKSAFRHMVVTTGNNWLADGLKEARRKNRFKAHEDPDNHPIVKFFWDERKGELKAISIDDLVREVRNMAVHLEEKHLHRFGAPSLASCAGFLDKVLPGIFSAIHYTILKEGLTPLVEGDNFW